jgi:hypothetical protein
MSTEPTPEPPGRALDIDADDLAGALAARRELGPDAELAVIAGFLDRVGQAIDARVAQQVARHTATVESRADGADRRRTGLLLALGSIALGIPVMGVLSRFDGVSGAVLAAFVWTAIAAINIAYQRGSR